MTYASFDMAVSQAQAQLSSIDTLYVFRVGISWNWIIDYSAPISGTYWKVTQFGVSKHN